MNKLSTTLLIIPCLFAMASCGDKQVLCSDGTTNHDYLLHELEEFEEQSGHDTYYSCLKCTNLFDKNKKHIESIPVIEPKRSIIIPNKLNGQKVDILNSVSSTYLSLDKENDIAAYLYNNQDKIACSTEGVRLAWESRNSGKSFTVELAKDQAFTFLEKTVKNITSTSITVYNLVPGIHYYRIKDDSNNYSLIDNFEIDAKVRTIRSDADGVRNIRDLAGWTTSTGDKMKYGMLYRSALPSSLDLSMFYWDLGIKTEMDLRIKGGANDEIKDFKGVGEGLINYVHPVPENAQFWPQYDQIFLSQYKQYTKTYFTNVFTVLSNKDNYPIDFHCKSGADRTGTLAYILNGLAGVSYADLTKDYELTSFYRSPRWRSKINVDGQNYSFDSCGYMEETGRWGIFHQTMMNNYGVDKTLPETILNFLTSYCEVDENLIKNTLSIILDGNGYMNLFNK